MLTLSLIDLASKTELHWRGTSTRYASSLTHKINNLRRAYFAASRGGAFLLNKQMIGTANE